MFPKNFFCALCSQLAIDSYKLLCCNKVICPSCKLSRALREMCLDGLMLYTGQEKLAFPTACPSCDHSPLEAESCTPNKTLRNTMRIWLQKQKKKDEAKAAAQATPTPVETPAPAEVQSAGDAADKPVDSIEDAPKVEGADDEGTAVENAGNANEPSGSAAPQTNEVGLCLSASFPHAYNDALRYSGPSVDSAFGSLAKMNMIVAARACEDGWPFTSPCTILILVRSLLRLRSTHWNDVLAIPPKL